MLTSWSSRRIVSPGSGYPQDPKDLAKGYTQSWSDSCIARDVIAASLRITHHAHERLKLSLILKRNQFRLRKKIPMTDRLSSLPEFPYYYPFIYNMKSRPIFLHALKLRQQAAIAPRPAVLRQIAFRPISTSHRLLNEQKSSQEGQQQQDGQSQKSQKDRKKRAEEEELNAPPQSPFKVFAQVLKEEISKNKAWQDNVKQLQGDVDKVVDSAAMKRAREVYERARVCL
jgi:hypothetical protein